MSKKAKSLFFPFSIEEEDRIEAESNEEQIQADDGYGLFNNDWYDTMGG